MFRRTRKMRNSISDRLVKVSDRSEHSYDRQSAKTIFLMKIALVWNIWDPIFGVGSPTSKKSTANTRHSIHLILFLNESSNSLVYGKNTKTHLGGTEKASDRFVFFSSQIFRLLCTHLPADREVQHDQNEGRSRGTTWPKWRRIRVYNRVKIQFFAECDTENL